MACGVDLTHHIKTLSAMVPFETRQDVETALKYIRDNFPADNDRQKFLKALFSAFTGLQLTKATGPDDAESRLKTFAAANKKISHVFIKTANPDLLRKNLCFDLRDGTYLALCMVVKDALIKAYGGEGKYLANLFTQLVHEYPRVVGVKLNWQNMPNPFTIIARFMDESGVNPFNETRVADVGSDILSRKGIEGFAKQFAEYKFAGDAHNLTILKDNKHFITPSNARKILGEGFDYVVSSNTLSPNAVCLRKNKEYTWEERNKLPEGLTKADFLKENARLLSALAGVSKDKAVHFHINCYDEGRTPCLFDDNFQKLVGLVPLAAKEFFGSGQGREGMYFYEKKGDGRVKTSELEKWLEENTQSWKAERPGRELVGKTPSYIKAGMSRA